MRARIMVALGLSLSGLQASEWKNSEGSRGSLAIIVDAERPDEEILAAMQSELSSIYQIPGLHLIWRMLDESTPQETFERMFVVRLRGDCAARKPFVQSHGQILGITHSSDGVVLPFAEVDCDRLRTFLPWLGKESVYPVMLGRALGRVIAHELFHFLVGTLGHSKAGIAQATFTSSDLTCQRLNFSEEDLMTLQRVLPKRGMEEKRISAVPN